MKLALSIGCALLLSVAASHAQSRGTRSILPDGSSVEVRTFVAEKRIEKRYFDSKDNLTKIAIYNTDAGGRSLKSAIYDPKGKLRYWERFIYAEDAKTLLEVKVFNPGGELMMKTTFEKGKPKVVDGSGRPMSEAEWKALR